MDMQITRKQKAFIEASADEVLFGGAAGGGKSYGQLVDALLFALRYPGSKQLILRRTYPELEKSIIRVSLELFPQEIAVYNGGSHSWRFKGGSIVDFGACDAEKDVYKYQSAEYDVIRFDELTHFTDTMYTYLISRVRGANCFPKQVKSSTNPGGVGHTWVKERFIDPAPPGEAFTVEDTGQTRVFIPSKVDDNVFLMASDPAYKRRLLNLGKQDQKALLLGDWDLDTGRYFAEWSADKHVMRPFEIPRHWRRYVAIDYGFDMLAALWIAVDEHGRGYVYREYCEGKDCGEGHTGLIASEAARAVRDRSDGEDISKTFAPPDLWNRRQETGRSIADYFHAEGVTLTKTSNDRINGWAAVHEWLKDEPDEFGGECAKLRIFDTCRNLIRCLPALQCDDKHPNDVATEPHAITHPPDALRAFCVYWTHKADKPRGKRAKWTDDMYEDYYNADKSGQEYLISKWGNPF